MEKTAYIILSVAAIIWVLFIFIGLVKLFPAGFLGLLVLIAIGLLLFKAIKDRLKNKEDDYYSKNVNE